MVTKQNKPSSLPDRIIFLASPSMLLQSVLPRFTSPSTSRRCIRSLLRNHSSSSSSFESRTYPGLYFHPGESEKEYSLSFLPTRAPSLNFSPTTIGQLSSPTSTSEEPDILPRYFKENPLFLDLVHEVLKEEIAKGDLWVQSLAKSVVNSSLEGNVDTYM